MKKYPDVLQPKRRKIAPLAWGGATGSFSQWLTYFIHKSKDSFQKLENAVESQAAQLCTRFPVKAATPDNLEINAFSPDGVRNETHPLREHFSGKANGTFSS